jgi:hypothetical protein
VIAHQQEENRSKAIEKKKKDAIIDALGELPSRCVLRGDGKESARITP